MSPVAEPSGSHLHELLPFYLLPTEFQRYATGLKVEFRQTSEEKMKNVQGLSAG